MTEYAQETCQSEGTETSATLLIEKVALRAVSHLANPVTGRAVLDLCCSDGPVSRWLALHGAHVTGIDPAQACIEKARHTESLDPHGISYVVGDPEDLFMVEDSSFDDVTCNLSLSRIESLAMVVAEVARIIRLGGRFIFTVSHPCFDLRFLGGEDACHTVSDYYMEGEREGLNGPMHHRTLATYINAVAARGFTVRRVLESAAEERDVVGAPEFTSWNHSPIVLAVEAVFPRL